MVLQEHQVQKVGLVLQVSVDPRVLPGLLGHVGFLVTGEAGPMGLDGAPGKDGVSVSAQYHVYVLVSLALLVLLVLLVLVVFLVNEENLVPKVLMDFLGF
eukprot:g36100.t1